MIATPEEKKKMLQTCIYQLKKAAAFSESLSAEPVRVETMTTLEQLARSAHSEVVSLRSLAAGNELPKHGG